MRVTGLTATDFRNYERAEVGLGERLTVIVGANGAGKTNLLEAIYFGCTGRSPRTSNDRDLLRRGATAARVTVTTTDDDGGDHTLEAAFQPGEPKLLRLDGSSVDNLWATDARPLISVFLPERLELVKGAPANRRAHLDQLVAALWPARSAARSAYSRALAQRNALLGRIRAGGASPDSLGAWDAELARHGADLMAARAEAVELLAPRFTSRAADLGLLALLFAERDLLAEERDRRPLKLLDDVMSELDAARRGLLADLLREGGQGVITATELDHVPGHDEPGTVVLHVEAGAVQAREVGAA